MAFGAAIGLMLKRNGSDRPSVISIVLMYPSSKSIPSTFSGSRVPHCRATTRRRLFLSLLAPPSIDLAGPSVGRGTEGKRFSLRHFGRRCNTVLHATQKRSGRHRKLLRIWKSACLPRRRTTSTGPLPVDRSLIRSSILVMRNNIRSSWDGRWAQVVFKSPRRKESAADR